MIKNETPDLLSLSPGLQFDLVLIGRLKNRRSNPQERTRLRCSNHWISLGIEQMMRGRLITASSIGGLAEVVGDAAMLFTPGDGGSLTHCMKAVSQNPDLVIRYGAKARQRATEIFNCSRTLEEHARIYRHLLQRSSSSRPLQATAENTNRANYRRPACFAMIQGDMSLPPVAARYQLQPSRQQSCRMNKGYCEFDSERSRH